MRLSRRRVLTGLAALAVGGALGAHELAQVRGANLSSVNAAIARGVDFLTLAQPRGQYSPGQGLLREAPEAAPCKYWLFNDNALAGHLLTRLGQPLAAGLLARLRDYGRETNGLHEVLWGVKAGETLDWTPRTHRYECFTPGVGDDPCSATCGALGTDVICHEERRGEPMPDWQEFADLALYGALNQDLLGDRARARDTVAAAMGMWDGKGFADKAYLDSPQAGYLTYKVGLALHVGGILGSLGEGQRASLVDTLLAQQETSIAGKAGGFYTHYGQAGPRTSDVNTETTALALWGLHTYRMSYRLYLPLALR